jgi:hypothetical protein
MGSSGVGCVRSGREECRPVSRTREDVRTLPDPEGGHGASEELAHDDVTFLLAESVG